MKIFIPVFFAFFISPLQVVADSGSMKQQINKACLRHAVSLVARLKSDTTLEMNQSQSDQALKLATESCQAYFSKEFALNAPDNNTEPGSDEAEKDRDWLTEHILSGNTERKDGNERLRKLKRR